MQRLTRRSLIERAMAAGAGATVLARLEPISSAAASTPGTSNPFYDSGFVKGTVASGSGGRFSVNAEVGGTQVIVIPDQSVVWKHGSQGGAVTVGDVVSARGTRQADGSLLVSGAWVDIHNFQATVLQSKPSELEVGLTKWPGDSVPIGIQSDSEVWTPPNGEFTQGNASGVGKGDVVQIVGFGDVSAGTFVGTRVFVLQSATYPPLTSGPDDQVITGASCPSYGGIASWFQCSGYYACSDCVYCSSSYRQMAWPKLIECNGSYLCDSGCNGNDCGSTCCPDLPDVRCGGTVYIYDGCTGGKSVYCQVADCGPCVRCLSSPYGCDGYYRVKFDLTEAAFSAIAPLSYGLTDVQAAPPC